jgi:hypothetical protein
MVRRVTVMVAQDVLLLLNLMRQLAERPIGLVIRILRELFQFLLCRQHIDKVQFALARFLCPRFGKILNHIPLGHIEREQIEFIFLKGVVGILGCGKGGSARVPFPAPRWSGEFRRVVRWSRLR